MGYPFNNSDFWRALGMPTWRQPIWWGVVLQGRMSHVVCGLYQGLDCGDETNKPRAQRMAWVLTWRLTFDGSTIAFIPVAAVPFHTTQRSILFCLLLSWFFSCLIGRLADRLVVRLGRTDDATHLLARVVRSGKLRDCCTIHSQVLGTDSFGIMKIRPKLIGRFPSQLRMHSLIRRS